MSIFSKTSVFTCVVAVLLLSGCAGDEAPEEKLALERPAEQIFKEAQDAEKEGSYGQAATLYAEVERQHPYSDYATQAQIKQAEVAYANLKYDEAIAALDRFIELHPGSDKVDYAYYLKAMCFYEQISDVRRDQAMSRDALEALDTVIGRFPDSKYARDAKYKRDLVRDHLAGKEMEIGRYYMARGQYQAAINRFTVVVKDYQTTTHVPEALHRLTESYTALGLKDEATHVAAVLGHNYPGSEWYQDSYALLDPAQRENLKDERSWFRQSIESLLSSD
ncbi:MAG: outer membrane protein assembly factor BamD [Pseudobdellovibrionaceae bacterium]